MLLNENTLKTLIRNIITSQYSKKLNESLNKSKFLLKEEGEKPDSEKSDSEILDEIDSALETINHEDFTTSWYRFPQLNGGYFEMAKSLLDESKMKEIQNTGRQYKKYEKKGTLYGLIRPDGLDDNYNKQFNKLRDGSYEGIANFFKDLGWDYKTLGNALNKYFKNRMPRVGECTYLWDFFKYCVFYNCPKDKIDVIKKHSDFETVVTNRKPTITKSSITPQEFNALLNDEKNIGKNRAKNSITIDDMFKRRREVAAAQKRS